MSFAPERPVARTTRVAATHAQGRATGTAAARAAATLAGVIPAAVSCQNLTKRFGAVVAVDGVTLAVERGEILAFLGPSGCGKTTFLRLIAGLEVPDAGSIVLDDTVVAGEDARIVPAEKRNAGLVFQDYALFPHMTVGANVGFGVRDRSARTARGAEVLALVGLRGLDDRYPHELSGGQQQRVALARALAPRPAVVLLDEPFSNLDADLRARVRGEVREILRAAGASAIFVTHDQEEAFDIADRIAVMRDGRVEQLGRPEDVYHTPETRFVADFVGEAEFLPFDLDGDHVVTELGRFSIAGHDLDGGAGELMIRPEDITLWPDAAGAGEVIVRRFQGPLNMTVVRLPSGAIVTSAHSSQTMFAPRERVRVSFRPDHLVLFRGERRVAWVPARGRTGTDAP